MTLGFGPFSVDPAQVVGLGGALFQNIVNRLLAAEAASAGMAGGDLRTSYQDNVGDQGVDAGVYAATQTTWIPAGDSAWQFKAGDLGPEGCAAELEGATRARQIIEASTTSVDNQRPLEMPRGPPDHGRPIYEPS